MDCEYPCCLSMWTVNIHIFPGRVSFQGETAGKETENMNTEEKKIAVIGIGGVGGYIAGLLAKAYPHVTMVARGARAESIRKKRTGTPQ